MVINESTQNIQATADAEEFISKGLKVSDGRIERFYRNNPTACYDINAFFDAVYSVAEERASR